MPVDFRLRDLAQRTVGVLFFLQRRVEQLDGILVIQFVRPGLQRAVAGYLIMLDSLRGGEKTGIKGGRAGLLLRSSQPMAARHQREHQRAAAPVLSKGYRSQRTQRDDLEAVALALNTRPRKTLGWKTPAETLDEFLRVSHTRSVATTG